MSSVRDVSERSHIEKELQEANDRLHAILEGLDVGVFVISVASREILYANSYLKDLFDADIVGKKCTQVFGYRDDVCEDCYAFAAERKAAHSTDGQTPNTDIGELNGYSFEYRLPNVDRWFWINIRPISWEDNQLAA